MHNIFCVLDRSLPKIESFKGILDFMDRIRIQKALTDQHKAYRSHVERFFSAARFDEKDNAIHSYTHVENEDIEVIITKAYIRRVLEFNDKEDYHVGYPERLANRCFFRMGYTGFVNDPNCNKANSTMPYKFLVHSVIHAMGHRKGGYDVAVDYIVCMKTILVLNLSYNFSNIHDSYK
ncbi:hypothetical protein Hanom_Chr10g00915731 [Helianthus anomalus]